MQCPECFGYRHDGPCEDDVEHLHQEYQRKFDILLAYLSSHSAVFRTKEQDMEVARLETDCSRAKLAYLKAKSRMGAQ